jgi:hypothetical protein
MGKTRVVCLPYVPRHIELDLYASKVALILGGDACREMGYIWSLLALWGKFPRKALPPKRELRNGATKQNGAPTSIPYEDGGLEQSRCWLTFSVNSYLPTVSWTVLKFGI